MFYHKYSKYYVYIGVLIALALTATCSLQPFSSVRVKARPEVHLPLGSAKITVSDIEEKLGDIAASNEDSSSGTKARIFRYAPPDATGEDKNQLRYLIHYPVQSLDFDISNYFGENAVSSDTGLSYKVDEKISIPTLDTTESFTIVEPDVINAKLLEAFNNAETSTLPSIDIPVGTPSGHSMPIDITINFAGFEELTLEYGTSLTLLAELPAGMTCSFSDAKLTSNGNTFDGYNLGQDKVRFSIYNSYNTISKSLRLTGTMTLGGSVSSGGTVRFRSTLEGTIKEAKGVNAHLEHLTLGGVQTVELPLPDDFKKATIEKGSLKFAIQQPEGWSGIDIKEKTKIEQSGASGLLIDPPAFRSLGTPIPLATLKLNDSKTLTYTPELDVTLTNATYRKPSKPLSADFSFSIQEFTDLTLKNKDTLAIAKTEPIPEAMKKWINKREFNEVSATVKMDNGLPEGNPITVKLSSTALNISPQSQEFPSQKSTEHTYSSSADWILDVQHTHTLDLNATVELPNYNDSDKTFTLKNISTGTDIKVSVETKFTLDWKKITLKAQTGQSFSYPQGDNNFIDLSALSNLKKAYLKMPDMPVYVYAGTASGLLADKPIKIGLSARYKEEGSSTPQSMTLCNETPCILQNFPADKFVDTKKEYTEAIPPYSFAIKHGITDNTLADIFNKYPTGVQLAYTVTMDEMEVDRATYDNIINAGGKAEIKLDVLLEIPVGFTIETTDPISFMPFMKGIGERDILNRTSANDKLLDERITKALQSIQLNANIRNESGFQPTITFQAKAEDGSVLVEKELSSVTGKQDPLKFTKDDWNKLQNTYPVYPEILLQFPADKRTIKINKDFTVSASLSVSAKTDIDYSMKVN